MGRRKERRIAAAGGRRVKLDLFAEPSGDLGGSSGQEQVGGDGDSITDAKSPSSPSSSGTQPQNPLLLLEQYSDDELDEDSNHVVAADASIDNDEETKPDTEREAECAEINHGKDPTVQKVEQLLTDNDSASRDPLQKLEKESIAGIHSDDLQNEINKLVEAASDNHLIGDATSGWNMVLHEESNQYYYWNIVTGETSWEVPDVFVQETVTTSAEQVVGDPTGKYDTVMEENMEEDDISTGKVDVDSEVNCQISNNAGKGKDDSGGDSMDNNKVNRDANQSNGTSMLGVHTIESKSGTDLPMQFIKQCESLLERLNSVKSSKCDVEGQDLRFKWTLETEIRLADMKALAYHGSSLLAFWLHSESQLKKLEAALDGLVQHNNSTSLVGFKAALESRVGDDKDTDLSEREAPSAAVESHAGYNREASNFEACNDGAITTEQSDPDNNLGGQNGIARVEKESESTPRPAPRSAEDVDMDVDMEVEDASPMNPSDGGASGAHYHVSTELSNLQNSLAGQEAVVFSAPPPVEEWIPPPPPDDEPFPPPPPDDEPFPPPPPDEPPGTSYIPPHLGSVQPFSYPDHYSLPYPASSLEYYGQTTLETSGATFYMHSEGGQIPVSHLPQYYEAVPNIYAVAPVIVNPAEHTAYYGLQSGTLNPVPVVSERAQSTGTLSEPVLVTMESGRAGSVDSRAEDVSNLLPKTSYGIVKSPREIPVAQPSIVAPATSSVANSVSASSMSDTTTSVSAPPATATSKTQSKVPRGKKRTVAVVSTLRSNKKVSSLVDKWKAAKEELQEEEEEPEDAYEVLEKKRQREIEEWRAHQIATGEAKDNANFQPLGGDWRERVKRKRAQKMKESSPDIDTKKQTDLTQLSKGLPSGWQVFLDDSSKQVYYGNMLTSETTWTRPTD
ncbi:hypothetical protein ABFS82_13G156600 [Erythranthe guttata]|uniref:formin-binding protein 4 n=1 Tax=Erythranthe guttata TaxID=4155 RepID=UPI00064E1400|nr:PREDICTED: formin-binding protein 4 [Erythranthe guttata]|eukprot:XP_012848961.1 PREDICTED: formin-binding protein 4 [Erythranthe guttata]